jgi:hypothetical protein
LRWLRDPEEYALPLEKLELLEKFDIFEKKVERTRNEEKN